MLAAAAADNEKLHRRSVAEVPYAGEDHRDAVGVGRRDHFRIALAAARLDNRRDPVLGGDVDAVAKRKKRIRGH
ncbi:MAG: hypothetical protein NZM12_12690, partial [Steroidobacteraceae bacterium]|nr:hypothetical protein [Steroidobacteraceae bacterium]